MKKLITYTLLCIIFTSCKEFIYTTKYHSPSTLFDKEQFIKNPNYWQFYIYDTNGGTYKARSGSFDSTSLETVLVKTNPIHIPDTLNRSASNRKNEIHIYIKDSSIQSLINKENALQRVKINKNEVIEVISYMNPGDIKNEKKVKQKRGAVTILSMIIGALGLLTLSIVIVINAISNALPWYCFVATMVYGSYNAPEVLILRRFRDEKLNKTIIGRLFIGIYYTFSPLFVKCFKNVKFINLFIKKYLDHFVDYLKHKNNW